jgi:hypothetical protein
MMAPVPEPVVTVKNLTKRFGDIVAVDALDFMLARRAAGLDIVYGGRRRGVPVVHAQARRRGALMQMGE